MHKILSLALNMGLALVITLFSVLMPGMAVSAAGDAEDTAIGDVTDPGILPDSGFYFMKSWGRNLQLMFAGSDTERARLMLKYTNEDALALKKMYEKGKYDVGAEYAGQYALQLQNTVRAMEQVRTEQGSNASEELIGELKQNYLKQQQVLLSVLEKAPETAQDGLLNAIENTNKHVGAVVMAQNGEQALQQYQEQVNTQTQNMGETTMIKVQNKLEVRHGQATQSSGSNSAGQGVMIQQMTQTQTQTQAENATQTMQQGGQPNMQNQGAGQSNTNSVSDSQGIGNKKQGK